MNPITAIYKGNSVTIVNVDTKGNKVELSYVDSTNTLYVDVIDIDWTRDIILATNVIQ